MTDDQLQQLLKDVQYLKDRQAILDVIMRHARGHDRHDAELMNSCFWDDGVDEHGQFVTPGPQYGDWANKVHTAGYFLHMHNITNHTCEIDGDTAHCETYVIGALLPRSAPGRAKFVSGRYLDRLERRDGEWRILVRRTTIEVEVRGRREVAGERDLRDLPQGRVGHRGPVVRAPAAARLTVSPLGRTMTVTSKYGPWGVVAGGSDGVGAAFARGMASRGINVVLVARRVPVLEASADDIRARYGVEVRTVPLDLSAPGALQELADATSDLEIGLFVYNAGGDDRSAAFLGKDLATHLELVRRNCVSVLEAAYRFGAPMVARRRGAVVLVTSGAAWAGGATLATYGATKAFDLILAESLWAEWRDSGVDVLGLVLGRTDTPSLRRVLRRERRVLR